METPQELERRAEQLEEEAILLEEAGRTVAAQVKAQRAKTLRDRASLLGQQAGRQPHCACGVWCTPTLDTPLYSFLAKMMQVSALSVT